MGSSKQSLSLASFFVFNSSFGPREGEEEKKILFYYPPEVTIDARIRDVGLCEAIIKFTNTFSVVENTCKLLRTQKTVQLLHQAEPDYWMVMIIHAPFERKTGGSDGEYNEYKGDQVHEKIYENLLKQAYHLFRMFSGTFESYAAELTDGVPMKLTGKLNEFYSQYMSTLKLNHYDILTVFQSLHYIPLEQTLFLRVHNFIQVIKSTFPQIKNCILMHDEQMVWSEINPNDMYSVFQYIVNVILPKTPKYSRTHPNGDVPFDDFVFVTGPAKFKNSVTVPTVQIYHENECRRFQLILYKTGTTVFGMFFEESATLTDDTYHELHMALGSQLSSIGSAITESLANASMNELSLGSLSPATSTAGILGPRYLFLNELNLKHTGTLCLNHLRSSSNASLVPTEVMNLLADLFDESGTDGDTNSEETVLKTLNDYWIVRRSSNWRHFFVVVNKSSTLLSVTEEARAIFDEHAKKVFFDK